jgi:DNA-binding transcriptional LysR family regulator
MIPPYADFFLQESEMICTVRSKNLNADMRFRSYDSLRLFLIVAENLSFSAASAKLNLTKGAVSYQITQLEQALEFSLFDRHQRGITLTDKGRRLYSEALKHFSALENEISNLRKLDDETITVATSTYFASRWLSPRLMTFIVDHPTVRLSIQPLVDLIDLEEESVDLVIRWGKGQWNDMAIERLFACPAFPTADPQIAQQIKDVGIEQVLIDQTLFYDRQGSDAWADWHELAGIEYQSSKDNLIIPDPNVRVQAVIDGQGIAINDNLVSDEMAANKLVQISPTMMENYGYHLAYKEGAQENPALQSFCLWLLEEGRLYEEEMI